MRALYNGRCPWCSGPIRKDADRVVKRGQKWGHATCPPVHVRQTDPNGPRVRGRTWSSPIRLAPTSGRQPVPIMAGRDQRAREDADCPWCPDPIRRGDQLGQVGRSWGHDACARVDLGRGRVLAGETYAAGADSSYRRRARRA